MRISIHIFALVSMILLSSAGHAHMLADPLLAQSHAPAQSETPPALRTHLFPPLIEPEPVLQNASLALQGIDLLGPPPRDEEVRIALVIGNANYQRTDWALTNPLNDARLIRDRLDALGFDVDFVPDATRSDMIDAFQRYRDRMDAAGDKAISVVYYAGHAVQDDGINYLIPVGATDIETVEDAAFHSLRLNQLFRYMRDAGNAVNLVFLDACRNNPLRNDFRNAGRGGLADDGRQPNVMIGYAALPGRLAPDVPDEGNSHYTAALAHLLAENQSTPIAQFMADLGHEVIRRTDGRQQTEFRHGLARAPRWSFVDAATQPLGKRDDGQVTLRTLADFLSDIRWEEEERNSGEIATLVIDTYGLAALETLASFGNADALMLMGSMHRDGIGTTQDMKRAAEFYDAACLLNQYWACTNLGVLYDSGEGVAQDIEEAARLYRLACDGGEMLGCNNLGYQYATGEGVAQDVEEAVRLYRLACDGGEMNGCSNLGLLYAKGEGVGQDFEEAVRLYRLACDGGNMLACNDLGYQYSKGESIVQDFEEAVRLYRLACDGGEMLGCVNLGALYANGEGVAQDIEEAIRLYRLACDGGNISGCANLGYRYANGEGVAQDFEEAVRLFRLACDGGNMIACRNLVLLYQRGQGVPQDRAEAQRLLQKGCDAGDSWACDRLE